MVLLKAAPFVFFGTPIHEYLLMVGLIFGLPIGFLGLWDVLNPAPNLPNLLKTRLKQSGMFWTVEGANAIIALRCCRSNQRFEDFWAETRAA